MPADSVMTGFFGKLPCRGDFLRRGLPNSFVAPWDGWLSGGLAASREQMGEEWMAAWMEAPVWRFLLPPGVCGPAAVLGLWMPSVDSAGRCFPLTIAAIFQDDKAVRGEEWLQSVEEAGRTALEGDMPPAVLSADLERIGPPTGDPAGPLATWWTEGAPRVPASMLTLATMPPAGQFSTMLGGEAL